MTFSDAGFQIEMAVRRVRGDTNDSSSDRPLSSELFSSVWALFYLHLMTGRGVMSQSTWDGRGADKTLGLGSRDWVS